MPKDTLILKGIKIFEKLNGSIFIAFPAIQGKDKTFHDIVIPRWEIESVFRNLDSFIKEIFEAQEFFIFIWVVTKLLPAYSQFYGEAG